jgi:hypothetical protein
MVALLFSSSFVLLVEVTTSLKNNAFLKELFSLLLHS